MMEKFNLTHDVPVSIDFDFPLDFSFGVDVPNQPQDCTKPDPEPDQTPAIYTFLTALGLDPNHLTGPAGLGEPGWIAPQTMPYTIQFENDPTKANAPAQEVFITQQLDQLDSNLDWSTFQLGGIGFGDQIIAVPYGLQQFHTRVNFHNPDGSPLLVDVAADFNRQTGVVTWTIRSVDPATGALPTDPFAGFLPVNDVSGSCAGFVTFTVRPKAGLPSGTAVSELASIVFDSNDPLSTNVFTNTIDATPPTSGVQALPQFSQGNFPVTWGGSDAETGVAFYDVYVSIDDGVFTLWKSKTTATMDMYPGTLGHHYAFYSVATDNVGNVEQKTLTAEGQTSTPIFQVTLPAVLENAKTAAGASIASLIKNHVSDPDPKAQQGIAVVGLSGNGKWQYSVDGKNWPTIGSVSIGHTFLLPATDRLRYLPAVNEIGQFNLMLLGWDHLAGAAGKFADASVNGGANSVSGQSGLIVAPVTHVNQAPTWTGNTAYLTPVLPGSYSLTGPDPVGDTVTGVFGSLFSDADGNNAGVAIVSATATSNGTWQYSTDGGTTWTSFGAAGTTFGVSAATNALLLSAADMLRFVPKSNFAGTATLGAYAWDGTNGIVAAAGATKGFAIAARGGNTVFSTALLTAKCAVNNAPKLGAANGPTLPAATEGVAKTVSVSTLFTDAQVTDDTSALKGIAIVGTGGSGEWPGSWQYSLDNMHWFSVPAVSESSAFLLPSSAALRFVAAIQANSSTLVNPATLRYRAWDQTAGTGGKLFAVTATDGATPISASEVTASMPVNFVNHAPIWGASTINLTPVLPGTTPTGNQVADAAAVFQDVDGNPVGVAVVAATGTSNGAWEFSSDGGTSWNTPLFAPSLSNALLLPAGDLVRFVPKVGFAGVVSVSAYAWDGTQGTAAVAGATKGFAIAARGGSTAFSTALLTVRCAVNNAPTFGTANGPTLPAATEGVAKTVTVSTLLTGGQVTDPNPGALKGIAVVGMGGAGQWPGTWQYSLNNMSWFSMPAVSESSAFLLPSTAFVRFMSAFQPNSASQVNPATLTYRAWDQTAGTSAKLFAVTGTGGATPFSASEVTASMPVNFVNHAPTWLTSAVNLTPVLPGTVPAGNQVSDAAGIFKDLDGNSVGMAIVSATGISNGAWQYSTDGGTNWTSFGAAGTAFGVLSATNVLLLSAGDLIRFLPNAGFVGTATLGAYAWDGTQGSAAPAGATKGFSIAARGGTTAFSTTLLTATILVDTAPVLNA